VKPRLPRLHAITDERIAGREDLAAVAGAVARGAGAALAFHARGRGLSGRAHYALACHLAVYPRVLLFVNDRCDIALAVGAVGVQLGHTSLAPAEARRLNPAWWIGQSVAALAEAEAAQAAGADYLVVGPVYPTATHPGRVSLGLAALGPIVRLGLPVIAIGGVTPERVAELRAAGVFGVAAIRALWDAPDPAAVAQRFVEELERHDRPD
jgi:thiamine-phosphate diphosphorylase